MCLAVFALGQHPRFPFVLAANRDEFFHRPTAPLDWWTPAGSDAPVLAGRDLSAGGTWFGLSAAGRLALLTNVRDPSRLRPDAPSRGRIVTDWLGGVPSLDAAHRQWQAAGFNGFNVVVADLAAPTAPAASPLGQWGWTSASASAPLPLAAGLHGVSNASLDTPWPKVQRLRQAMAATLAQATTPAAVAAALFAALVDAERASDDALPSTGVPLPIERALSSVFIRTDDGRYGTRCSTVVVREHDGTTHVLERTYADEGGELAWVTWPTWPGATLPPVQRLSQQGQGRGTALPSTLRNVSASW
jgi:uncharacterized protein with NRDE domain